MLAGTCLGLAAIQLWPRLTVQRAEVAFYAEEIVVAIDGAVRDPGSYTLPFGATIGDLVEAAGGWTGAAATALVNVADPLTHGELVVVPRQGTSDGTSRIDLNAASLEELQSLPGVGPVTAERIVAGRPYAALDELLRVTGIGPKTLARLRPHIGL